MASLRRTPATPDDDGAAYPTLAEHGESRRRFLKLFALTSAAATLGFQLVGCPGTGGGTGGAGGGGGGTSGTDWIPWQQDDLQPLAGEVVMVMGKPVGVVVAGVPIAATFKDGAKVEIVVAAVVTPYEGASIQADFVRLSKQHTELVLKTVNEHPSSALTDAAALDALEAALLSAINGTLHSGYIDEVSVAKKAEEPSPDSEPEPAREAEAPAEEVMHEAREEAAPTPAPVKRGPKTRSFWTTCRKPGCTTCG